MTIEGVTLRDNSPEDQAFLLELFTSSRERELENVNWSNEERQNFLAMQFRAQQTHYASRFPGREHKIVLLHDKPVGMLDVVKKNDEIRLLDIILCSENRNVGLGSQLIHEILQEAENTSLPTRLYVEKFNPALRLYQRMHFTVIEDTGVHYHMERLPQLSETLVE